MTGTSAKRDTRLDGLMIRDAARISGELARARRITGEPERSRALAAAEARIGAAEGRVERRRLLIPQLTFPGALPVSDRVDDLAAAISGNQVVVVAGETGSGKSTQLPKICLKVGRGIRGMIGHTQPRRIAARALAERIAEETGTELGRQIGYAVRFSDRSGPDTLVRLMTDGILLASIQRDRMLSAYDTIIIDEAHERSLNIDFLLGYFTGLLPRRPDLKLIITSATIDPGRFAAHFGGAPVVEVSGRTYPVEIRYRPMVPDDAVPRDDDDAVPRDDDDAVPRDDEDDDPDTDEPVEPDGFAEPDEDGSPGRRAPDQVPATTRGRTADTGRTTGPARRPRPRTHDPKSPAGATETVDLAGAISDAVDELRAAGDGDILVFLSGEREINDVADVLRAHLSAVPGIHVLPLYGRLSAADQHKVFSPHTGRRIVLATNVAETSLTVPGIRYVVDPGTARISRYSTRSKVQRLPIEPISQASANQRAGRCGRVADGICIRLYSRSDYEGRPEFTDPEIARTSLAAVILQMAALDLGDIGSFPFVEPPDTRQVKDGLTLLGELGALQDGKAGARVRLTETGRALAAFPLDPRLARMLVEADRLGCLRDLLVIVAALAIQDVREYPLEERDKATATHARFTDDNSDFLALVNLWHYLRREAKARSGNGFRRMCRQEYLHYLRIREWQDLHAQLRAICRDRNMRVDAGAELGAGGDGAVGDGDGAVGDGDGAAKHDGAAKRDGVANRNGVANRDGVAKRDRAAKHHGAAGDRAANRAGAANRASAAERDGAPGTGRGSQAVAVDGERIHTALLAGLLSHIGARVEPGREYQGTRGTTFAIWPGSALARSRPGLVVAAELVETSRLWARTVARVDPAWVERVGGHLLRRNYSEPRWDARRAAVLATERVTLLGVTLVAARTVQFDRVDPELSRELFIRHALVEGDWQTRHAFFAHNQTALEQVGELEDRARRRDIRIDDDALFALYDSRIPAQVTSGRHFDSWWKKASRTDPDQLIFTPAMLTAAEVDRAAYPESVNAGGIDLGVDYVFEPGRADDGVSLTIPLAVLARLDRHAVDAPVPGTREELAVALIRTLPKSLRRNFVPAADFAHAALARMPDVDSGAMPGKLARTLVELTGIAVTEGDFDLDKVPDHLRPTYKVVDAAGAVVGAGKDLAALQAGLAPKVRRAVAAFAPGVERSGLRDFPDDGVPERVTSAVAGQRVDGYPALVDHGDTVSVTVFTSQSRAAQAMRAGTVRLLTFRIQIPTTRVRSLFNREELLAIAAVPTTSVAALLTDATEAAIAALLDWAGGPAWTRPDFDRLAERIGGAIQPAVHDILLAGADVIREAAAAGRAVEDAARTAPAESMREMRAELATLVRPGFLTAAGAAQIPDVARYLRALAVRAARAGENPARDRERSAEIGRLDAEAASAIEALPVEGRTSTAVVELHRLLAEQRIALFAQPMRTSVPVSAKRIRAAISALTAGAR